MLGPSLAALLTSIACLFPAGDGPPEPDRPAVSVERLAGQYSFGDGQINCHSLTITPDGKFEMDWFGCWTTYDRYSGRAEVVGGHLILKPRMIEPRRIGIFLANVRKYLAYVARTHRVFKTEIRSTLAWSALNVGPVDFVPVLWGDGLYLVPATDARRFCNSIDVGLSNHVIDLHPDNLRRGFYRRHETEGLTRDGLPGLPAEWAAMLQAPPLRGRVVEVLERGKARIDLGSEAGAWAGMYLWIDSEQQGYARVELVEAKSSVIRVFDDEGWARVGRGVRTRKPGAAKPDDPGDFPD